MKTRLSRFVATTALAAPIAFATLPAVAAEDIGKVAAVNPSMDGTPPQQTSSRSLALGASVLQNERIETSEDGSGQLLFIDQTSLSIAPRSDIVLDKYIYDPGDESGEVALTLTKGVLRLIGGRITKQTDGIIRTPAATIGVRGGLALVVVEGARTRVCHIAGEYTKVSGFSGQELVLSRPNACAVIETGAAATFEGLISAEDLSNIYRQLEGRGTGGALVSADAIEVVASGGLNSSTKRGPFDQPVSTSGHRYVQDEDAVYESRQAEDNGITVVTVAVPQDPNDPTPVMVVTRTVPAPGIQPADPMVAGVPPDGPVEGEPTGLFLTGLSGGSVITVGDDGTGGSGFAQVLRGSLIGQGSDGTELRVPVPNTGGGFDAVFDTENIIDTFVFGDFAFSATDLSPNAGLFQYSLGDAEFDPGTGERVGGSFSSELGDIEGVGFTDEAEEFTYVEFSDGTDDPNFVGHAVFGNPTFNQGQFIADDATLTQVSPSLIVARINPQLVTDELVNGVANTVEAFEVQPSQYLGTVRRTESRRGQTPFFMVGNQGFGRVRRSDVAISVGDESNRQDLVGGGKWLNGALYIGIGDSGEQDSEFFAFGDEIRFYEGSGPIVGGAGFESSFVEVFEEEIDDFLPIISTGTQNLGTTEDLDGNTMFGQTNRYMVLSDFFRSGVEGDSVPPGFQQEAGSVSGLVQIDGDATVDGTTNRYNALTADNDRFNSLLAYDSSQDEVVIDPLPLAGARVERGDGGVPLAFQVDELNRGFVSGMAVCEGGLCGDVDNFTSARTGLSEGIDDFTGSYAIRTGVSEGFNLNFGGHRIDPTTGEAVDFDIDNSVVASFSATSTGIGGVANSEFEGFRALTFSFGSLGTTSAYIDDDRFAALGVGTGAALTGPDGGTGTADGSFALASVGLVGTSNLEFPAETELDPEFARWGWWSAELEVPLETGGVRTDLLHLGNWVAGVGYDRAQDHIPFSGVAAFGGLAVGTMTNYTDFSREIVGGNFNLSYDFGARSGTFNLNIPAAGLDETLTVNAALGTPDGYIGNLANPSTNTITDVSGAFFSNPNGAAVNNVMARDGIAATGGTFESVNLNNTTHTTGIFAGDRTSFTPFGQPGGRVAGSGGSNR